MKKPNRKIACQDPIYVAYWWCVVFIMHLPLAVTSFKLNLWRHLLHHNWNCYSFSSIKITIHFQTCHPMPNSTTTSTTTTTMSKASLQLYHVTRHFLGPPGEIPISTSSCLCKKQLKEAKRQKRTLELKSKKQTSSFEFKIWLTTSH